MQALQSFWSKAFSWEYVLDKTIETSHVISFSPQKDPLWTDLRRRRFYNEMGQSWRDRPRERGR